jgi:hypothetical protein
MEKAKLEMSKQPTDLLVTQTCTLPCHFNLISSIYKERPLHYKPEGRGFDSRRGSLGFFIGLILLAVLWPWGRLSL